MGERDGQERGHQTDSGVFTALQAGHSPARISKCQRLKSARQSARGEGKQITKTLTANLQLQPPSPSSCLLPTPPRSCFHVSDGPSLGLDLDEDLEDLCVGS